MLTLAPTATRIELPLLRPALLELLPGCDAWLDRCLGVDALSLSLRNRPVALLPATALDQPALNSHLFRLRYSRRLAPKRRA